MDVIPDLENNRDSLCQSEVIVDPVGKSAMRGGTCASLLLFSQQIQSRFATSILFGFDVLDLQEVVKL